MTASSARPFLLAIHRAMEATLHFERRLEPFFRRPLNRVFAEGLGVAVKTDASATVLGQGDSSLSLTD